MLKKDTRFVQLLDLCRCDLFAGTVQQAAGTHVSKKQAQTEFRGGGEQEFSALHQQDGEGGGNLSFFLWQHSIPAGESQ